MSRRQKSLNGTVVLVTGATRGIGKGVAIAFGELGATVYITGRTLEASDGRGSLSATRVEVEAAGGICIPIQVDHSQDDQVQQLLDTINTQQNGQLDVLINNVFAGVQPLGDTFGIPFWEADLSLWDMCHTVGLRSHYVVSHYAAKLMVPRKKGLICSISSWGGMVPLFAIAYGAGKSACDRMASDMAIELAPHHITSVPIWPGIVGTEQIKALVKDSQDYPEQDSIGSVMRDEYNWESPLFVGRAIARLALDSNHFKKSGKLQIVAELAKKYGVADENGKRPVSLRSLRFLIAASISQLRPYDKLIADIKIPWVLLLWKVLRSPQI